MALDDNTFQILNAIYLRKMAGAEHVAAVTSLDRSEVDAQLVAQTEAGRLVAVTDNYLMQPDGVTQVLAFYHNTYAPLRQPGSASMHWYERFESNLNQQFIKAVTDWQTSEGDERAAGRMMRIVERMIRALGELTPAIPRYRDYVRRFERSMALADQGQLDYVCNPTLDSMHNIWFEFHEDILAVVGRPRDQ
ncbi:hypothetical protein [Pseudomonas sp. LRF_L74]|uniref:hypothetical protein n=1 Tax=Pseudomonas sp. LRF_L74 TaxID=3369422 RepID=UPI003F60373C